MPITFVKPKPGRTPYYRLRGTYLRVKVDESTGTGDFRLAKKLKAKCEHEIESGRLSNKAEPTFSDAVTAYMQSGRSKRFTPPLIKHFKETPLKDIGQAEIDAAAVKLYPNASHATRNRQVHTPVLAVMKHVGHKLELKRPEGADGNKINHWLRMGEAFAVLDAAKEEDFEFYIMLYVFLYTGLRLSEVLKRECDDLHLSEALLFVPHTKNGEPRPVHLPPHVVAVLANHPRGADRPGERLFRFHKGSKLYDMLKAIAERVGVTLPRRSAFHLLRHTYCTWMRQHAGMDARGLVDAGVFKSQVSANRYIHNDVSEEAKKADLLPVPKIRSGT